MSNRLAQAIANPNASTAPAIVAIVNATPDSFSDGGQLDATLDHLRTHRNLIDGIDVGGESTRPGASRIDVNEQIDRVVPVIEKLAAEFSVPISIDTTRTEVAAAALDAGAFIVNDVSAGLESNDETLALAAERSAAIILLHMRGQPASMQNDPQYTDVVGEVTDFLLTRAGAAEAAGVPRSSIVLDPGIGFGKTTAHNLELLANLDTLVATGYAVMLGASRKRFLGELADANEPADRAIATAATTALGVTSGVRIFRVHDVVENRQAADVTHAALRHRSMR